MGMGWRQAAAAALVLLAAAAPAASHATSLRYCDAQAKLSAAQQDRLLRVAAIIKQELDGTGASLALMSRSGLSLGWFGMRYSHAGVSLKASPASAWAVRQLYFACEEQAPRLFDQGLTAFLMGADDPSLGFISVLTLPHAAAEALEPVALDNTRALQLLGATYSANAYAFAARYQNCNQWLAELLASAWGALPPSSDVRSSAQGWLKANGYEAARFELPLRPLLWLTALSPWLQRDDHPDDPQGGAVFRVSMPASIESFVRSRFEGAQRIEFCHTDSHVLVRRGWSALAEGCVPTDEDRVISLY